MPYLEQIHFPISSAGNEPTRYQMLSLDLRNLALVPALAIRFGNDLRIGLAPGFLFSTGTLDFAEDTALDGGPHPDCGGTPCEDPAAAARVHVASGQGLGGARFSLTLGGGIYWRRRNFEFGVSYQSRPLGSPQSGVEVAGQQSTRHAAAPAGHRAAHLRGRATPPAASSPTPPTGCRTWSSPGRPGTPAPGWRSR